MATLDNSVDVNHLIINIVPNNATFEDMQSNNQVNTDELYLITENNVETLSLSINNSTYEYDPEDGSDNFPNMYVPTTSGSANQILVSGGTGNAPTWTTPLSSITSSSTGIPNAAAVRDYVANNSVTNIATLTIGSYTYDGTQAVNIPVYDGTIA